MSDFAGSISLYSKAIGLRAQRQQVLASNIANADTPNYKARDFDFKATMAGALSAQGGGLSLAKTSAMHLSGDNDNAGINLQYRKETQSAVDGNTVDMDIERAEMTDNSLQYELLTKLITDHFQGLKQAMAGTQG